MKDAAGDTTTSLVNLGKTNPLTGLIFDTTSAKSYMLDKNPSSALKRYTNMAVCYSCHTSSHAESFKNVPDYQNNPAALNGMTDSKTATELGANVTGGDIGKSPDATGATNTKAVTQGYIR